MAAWGLMLVLWGQAATAPDLGWLAGYWLSCEAGGEVSETWSDPRGGLLLGTSLTLSKGKLSYEQMRIVQRARASASSPSRAASQRPSSRSRAFRSARWSSRMKPTIFRSA
jgi:hypothetical protein